jgi:hypothetical protein
LNIRTAVPSLIFLLSSWGLYAEPTGLLVVKVTPRVVEQDQSVSWEQVLSQVTSPGVPIVVKIDADPLKIRITVTPFVRGNDLLLVVQGDVIQTGPNGVRKSTSLQSMQVPPGEDIAYFPLGRPRAEGGRAMVVFLRVEPQDE